MNGEKYEKNANWNFSPEDKILSGDYMVNNISSHSSNEKHKNRVYRIIFGAVTLSLLILVSVAGATFTNWRLSN